MVLHAALGVNDLLLRTLNVRLKMHESVENGLGTWWTSGDVHIDRDDLIDTGYRCVIIVESSG